MQSTINAALSALLFPFSPLRSLSPAPLTFPPLRSPLLRFVLIAPSLHFLYFSFFLYVSASQLHLDSVSLISLSLTTLSNHKSASSSHNHKSTVSIISINKGLNVPSPSPSPSSLRHLDLDINYYQPSSSPIMLGSSSTLNS
ncbi:hypothetical protein PGT21_008935 [Puccinia graminis f. sp. tritici]|uniref:Uncharacterized protein n=1 Tax=Puccinia graminis f. sp. tritici TaxID=56615 RepID=A0A5B0NY14_PUCGR|nr:hypothetical protein PGTUg99_033615 [Puccinia graminis f. sp. tritici]KAA1094075.1 hypothetical protein PGT21_008935 [Puccinia graminis f. sp. tritici]